MAETRGLRVMSERMRDEDGGSAEKWVPVLPGDRICRIRNPAEMVVDGGLYQGNLPRCGYEVRSIARVLLKRVLPMIAFLDQDILGEVARSDIPADYETTWRRIGPRLMEYFEYRAKGGSEIPPLDW